MAKMRKEELEDPIRKIGPDSTATFDSSSSNPTERASSEVLDEATVVEDDEVEVDVELEDDDELDEDEDEDGDEENEVSPVM